MNNKRFKQTIIILTILLAIVMIIFNVAMSHKILTDQEKQTIAMVNSIAVEKDLIITKTIENWYTYAETIAELCIVDDSYDKANVLKVLDQLKTDSSPYVYAFDIKGDLIINDTNASSIADRIYFETVIAGNRTITDMMESKEHQTDEEIVAAVVPMKLKDGTVVGGVICAYHRSDLEKLLSNKSIFPSGVSSTCL